MDRSNPAAPLRRDQRLLITSLSSGSPYWIRCTTVHQRNWSRTGLARLERGAAPATVFFKQFLDPQGAQTTSTLSEELKAYRDARPIFGTNLIEPIGFSSENLTLIFPLVPLSTLDVIARSAKEGSEWESARSVIRYASEVLQRTERQALEDQLGPGPDLSATVYKGFEVRNLGIDLDARVRAFDIGPTRRGHMGEMAARFLISLLLLNWGRPLTRFAQGPKEVIFRLGFAEVGRYVRPQQLQNELRNQWEGRRTVVKGGRITRAAKSVGLNYLGQRYVDRCSAILETLGS